MYIDKRLAIGVGVILIIVGALSGCAQQYNNNTTNGNNTNGNGGTNNNTTGNGGTASISISADNLAFDQTSLTVPAGATVTVTFNNQDDGIPHNFAVYMDSSASTPIFQGETIVGVDQTTYTFDAPTDPGTYYFQCDVHPTTMNGDFIVT